MHAVVAEDMGDEAKGAKDPGERRVADIQPSGIGAEGRHDRAMPIGGKATSLHGAPARADTRLWMQMTGDLAGCTGRLVAEGDGADGGFLGDGAAEIGGQFGVVIAGNPDPVTPGLQCTEDIAIGG